MLVSDVLNAMSVDVRSVISSSTTFVPWVDRIQKNALHTSIYNYLLKKVATFSVTSGTSSYTVSTGSNTYRRLLMVYDRTFDRLLMPVQNLGLPASKAEDTTMQPLGIPKPMLSAATSEQWPEYYTELAPTTSTSMTVILFPAPQKTAFAGSYEAYYEMVVPDLAATTDTLLLPDDALDLMVAGVNMLATAFLKLDTETQYWTQQYEMLKKGVANSN